MNLPLGFNLSHGRALVACFAVGFLVRLVPEVLAFPNPIGFDTVYYAAVMKSGVVWSHWSSFFSSSWLLLALIVPFRSFLGVDPFSLLKVFGPALFGFNVAGVYWFARKALAWDVRLSVLAGGFFALQLASLRISWDLLRNTLGLGLLLFTMPFVSRFGSKRGLVCFVLLSLLTVFAHEYAAVTLVAVVLGLVFWRFIKDKHLGMESKRLLLGFSPALAVFLVGIYLRIFPVRYAVETNVISAGDAVNPRPFGLFFLVDYLRVRSTVDYYEGYWSLVLNVVVLFGLLYLPYLFLVWRGFFRHGVLSVWTGLLLVGSFGCLVVPFSALEYWHRWMFMLVYPFTFYAVNGLRGFMGNYDGENSRLTIAVSGRKVKGMLLLTVLLGGVYLATPVLMSSVNVGLFSVSAVNKFFSFAPTVPYEDVDSVVEAMKWLDGNMDGSSCVVLQHAFLSRGQLYLDKSHTIVHFENDVNLAVDTAFEHGFTRVFFVWWNEPIGWYGITVPEGFVTLRDFCRISVYEFLG